MGNPDGALIDNALSKKPQVVTIEPTDKAFKTHGCQPWQNTGSEGAAPAGVPGPEAGPNYKISSASSTAYSDRLEGECLSPN